MTIVEPHGEVGRLVTTTIRTKKGEEKRVKVSELRALAAAMPLHMIPAAVQKGAFIMYNTQRGWNNDWGNNSGGIRRFRRADYAKEGTGQWQGTKAAHVHTGKKCPQTKYKGGQF